MLFYIQNLYVFLIEFSPSFIRKFEDDIIASSEMEDPLSVWIKYISWVRSSFPSDTTKTMLILERCTEAFKSNEKYLNDIRYVKIWIEYADMIPTPGEIFAFMQSNKIGEKVSLFWVAWAFVCEKHQNFPLTEKIYLKGIQK